MKTHKKKQTEQCKQEEEEEGKKRLFTKVALVSENSHCHKSCAVCSSRVSVEANKVHNDFVDMHSNTPLRILEENSVLSTHVNKI